MFNYFWILFIIGILAGIFLPFLSLITPYISYMLMFVFFLSCLKINTYEFFNKIKNFKLVSFLSILILMVVPVLLYLLFSLFLSSEYSLAILILLVMPAGMSILVYADIFHGDCELALALLIITSLLCPLTIPLLIFLISGVHTNLNLVQMFLSLSKIVLIPFVLSIVFRKFGKNIINQTKKYYSPVSIIIIALIMAGAIAKIDVLKVTYTPSIIFAFGLLFVLAILLHLIGYFIVYKCDTKTKITSSLAMGYMNSTLAIVFAAQFFGPNTLLLVVLYQIPTNLVLSIFGYFFRKSSHNFTNA